LAWGTNGAHGPETRGQKKEYQMNILYELEFDLDGFIESMEQHYPARRRIEAHMENRRLRAELASFEDDDEEDYDHRVKTAR
jgi:hypothetical protein